MTEQLWLGLGIFILGAGSIAGIFLTKSPGWGRFTTSVLLLALVLFVSALCLAFEKLESSVFANVLFAVAGFAGGLLANKKAPSNPTVETDARKSGARGSP